MSTTEELKQKNERITHLNRALVLEEEEATKYKFISALLFGALILENLLLLILSIYTWLNI